MTRWLVLLCWSTLAIAKPEVLWIEANFPPIFIIRGELAGQGYGQQTQQYFSTQLHEFGHVIQHAALLRFINLAKTKDGLCFANALKTPERAEFLTYSLPIYLLPSHHVIIQQDQRARFTPHLNAYGEIDLGRLMGNSNFTTSVNPQRAFSPHIDAIIRANLDEPHINKVVQNLGMFERLEAGWLDYLVAYIEEAVWYTPNNRFVYLPIADNPPFVLGHIACSNLPLGRQVIAAVDEIVRQAPSPPPWSQHYRRWLDAAGQQRYDALLERYRPFDR